MKILFAILLSACFVFIGLPLINSKAEQEKVNHIQFEKNLNYIKNELLSNEKSITRNISLKVEEWIDKNISDVNKEVFKAYAEDIRKQTLALADDTKFYNFVEIEDYIHYYIYCIVGEEDLAKFEEFLNSVIYETEGQKKLLQVARKKYDKYSDTIDQLDNELVEQFCGFKRN